MKPLKALLLVLASASAAAFAGGHLEQDGYPAKGLLYTFELYTGPTDRWDPEKQEAPPLAAGKAARLAQAFVKNVPLEEQMTSWDLRAVSLKRLSSAPQEWVYIVHFDAVPRKGPWNGPVPSMDIPVRMDGSIPQPVVQKK